MTSIEGSGQILKTDALARVRTPPERKRELLDEFARSGLTGAKFAALVGVKYSTLAGWAAKRRRHGAATPAAKVRWLEAVMDRAQESGLRAGSILTLQFPAGARAEIANIQQAELAAALLRALDKPAGC